MTRKRFVKLLMASGVSRNQANLYAPIAIWSARNYAEGYENLIIAALILEARENHG